MIHRYYGEYVSSFSFFSFHAIVYVVNNWIKSCALRSLRSRKNPAPKSGTLVLTDGSFEIASSPAQQRDTSAGHSPSPQDSYSLRLLAQSLYSASSSVSTRCFSSVQRIHPSQTCEQVRQACALSRRDRLRGHRGFSSSPRR